MDADEFRTQGKAMVDFIADYMEGLRERPVRAPVPPGFMTELVTKEAPQHGEDFQRVMDDLEPVVMKGVTSWQHPNFHAYYPTAFSYPSILGDMLSDAIASVGFSWTACPSCTELEIHVLDWLAKSFELPEHFLSPIANPNSSGGGVIQGTASEASLVAVIAARSRAVGDTKCLSQNSLENTADQKRIFEKLGRLVAYCSDQAHSSVERAAMLGIVRIRKLGTDDRESLRGETLKKAIQEDKANGDIPFLCIGTIGTTSSCAFDNIEELGQVCKENGLWLHVDAAYAGSALICPEFRYLGKGLEMVDSFNFNAHKWLRVNFDCSVLWLKESKYIVDAFNVDPLYLKQEVDGMPDFRHWQIPLGRRFRAIKIWFVLRSFGVEGLQEYIRSCVKLAKRFQQKVVEHEKFEIFGEVVLGLVCFRLKGENSRSEKLMQLINEDKRIFLVPSKMDKSNMYFLRFAICSPYTEEKDIDFAFNVVSELANEIA